MFRIMQKNIIQLVTITSALSLSNIMAENKAPNIIFILTDDLGYTDLSSYGSKVNRTPQIDKLARDGVLFTDAYAASSISTPSRAAFLTGKYPIRTGLTRVVFPNSNKGLKPEELTIAEMLQQNGYYTGIIGKWHLGSKYPNLPLQHGFDEYFGIPYSNDMTPCVYMRGNEVVCDSIDQRITTKTYTEEAVDFIRKNKYNPFFLFLSHTMPHVPLYASKKFEGKSKNGIYGDVIEELDWSVGRVMQELKRLRLDSNTIVIFTSDNGPWLSKGPDSGVSTPLFHGKFTTWEGGHRVPMIAYWKGKIKPAVYKGVTSLMDWMPTFAELSNTSLPDTLKLDGVSLTGVLLNQSTREHDDFVYYEFERLSAYRSRDYKLILPRDLRKGNQYVKDVPAHDTLLFNLREDIGETINLFNADAKKTSEMIQKLELFKSQNAWH